MSTAIQAIQERRYAWIELTPIDLRKVLAGECRLAELSVDGRFGDAVVCAVAEVRGESEPWNIETIRLAIASPNLPPLEPGVMPPTIILPLERIDARKAKFREFF